MCAPIRILHVYKDYPPVIGGIEGTVHRLATSQAALGHDVSVLVTAEASLLGTRIEEGVRVIRTRRWLTLASTPLGPGLPLRMLQARPDICHLHFPYPLGELAHLVFGRSRKTVVTYYSDVVRQRRLGYLWAPFARRLLRRADAVLATSPPHIAGSRLLREIPERCRVIPLGIDVQRFAAADLDRVAALRSKWGTPLLLFVGRLRYYKGLSVLLEAMEDLEGAQLLVVGEGPMGRDLKRQAAQGRAEQRIHFLGEVADEELPSLYASADVFVLPSVEPSEAFGLAQVEAMASGTPVVGTALGSGTDWVNLSGETGLVVPPRDPRALAAAIARLLDDEGLRTRLGRAAKQRAGELFSTESMVRQTLAVYGEVLGEGGETSSS